MPSLNFKSRFAGLVQTGKKTQTIRAPRVYPIKVGDRLILSVGARTKHYRQIGEGVATLTQSIVIEFHESPKAGIESGYSITVDGLPISPAATEQMARADGFASMDEMGAWFRKIHGLPFAGNLIHWRLTTAP